MSSSQGPFFTGPMFPLRAGKPLPSPRQETVPVLPQRLHGKIVHIHPESAGTPGAVHRVTIELLEPAQNHHPLLHTYVEIVVCPPQ
jgi:hypothetical protein